MSVRDGSIFLLQITYTKVCCSNKRYSSTFSEVASTAIHYRDTRQLLNNKVAFRVFQEKDKLTMLIFLQSIAVFTIGGNTAMLFNNPTLIKTGVADLTSQEILDLTAFLESPTIKP